MIYRRLKQRSWLRFEVIYRRFKQQSWLWSYGYDYLRFLRYVVFWSSERVCGIMVTIFCSFCDWYVVVWSSGRGCGVMVTIWSDISSFEAASVATIFLSFCVTSAFVQCGVRWRFSSVCAIRSLKQRAWLWNNGYDCLQFQWYVVVWLWSNGYDCLQFLSFGYGVMVTSFFSFCRRLVME